MNKSKQLKKLCSVSEAYSKLQLTPRAYMDSSDKYEADKAFGSSKWLAATSSNLPSIGMERPGVLLANELYTTHGNDNEFEYEGSTYVFKEGSRWGYVWMFKVK